MGWNLKEDELFSLGNSRAFCDLLVINSVNSLRLTVKKETKE